MGGMKVLLRILLSLSVFVAGFGHAMPAELIETSGVVSISHPHCEDQAGQPMDDVAHDALHDPSGQDTGKHHAKGGCCKAGSCPCPHVAPAMWEGAKVFGSRGRHASDFALLQSDYRSPALERLIRPPIA